MMAVAEQQYPQLDMNSVRESVKRFNLAKVGREFDFVSSLQDRVDSVSELISASTRTLLSECAGLEVIVGNAGFGELRNQWLKVGADGASAEEVRTAVHEQIKTVYSNKLQRVIKATAACDSTIASLLGEVAEFNLEHNAEPLMDLDADALKRYQGTEARLQAKIDELKEDKKILDEAIEALQSKTWWDSVKGILPTASEIEVAVSSAVLGKADASLIGVALDRVSKYIELFESGRKFSDMTSAKLRITDELKTNEQAFKDNKKEIDALNQRAEKIKNFTQLQQGRDLWVKTLESIRPALQQFLDVCESLNNTTEEAIMQAPDQQADFVKFLRSLNK